MTAPLEELKQQRKQIQQHLEWLDAKIAEHATNADDTVSSGTPPPEEPTAQKLAKEPPIPSLPVLPTGAQLCQATAVEPSEPSETPPTTMPQATSKALDPEIAADIESSYKPKTQNDILKAKIGCLALFILGTALFLFLLFGLPYIW